MSQPDWSQTSADYAKHRHGFPERFYAMIEREGLFAAGLRVLDIGTGTGTVARELARRGGDVLGLDPAPAQLAAARALAQREGVAARFAEGLAERTGQPADRFDLVVAAQCWHWFDRGLAAAEAKRVLKPGGALLICHYDWLPLPGSVAHATEFLIEARNPRWRMGRGTGFYPNWAGDLATAGFDRLAFAGFDHVALYAREDWRGRVRASAGVGGTLDDGAVAQFDAELGAFLDARFPGDPLSVPHRVFAIWAFKPARHGEGRLILDGQVGVGALTGAAGRALTRLRVVPKARRRRDAQPPFEAPDRATVDRFHAAGLAHGGKDEGRPGLRHYHDHYYGAYVRDPDGNKLCCACHRGSDSRPLRRREGEP
jgi:SAM-dependent methyltransferase